MSYYSFKTEKIGKTVRILMLQILILTTVFSLISFTHGYALRSSNELGYKLDLEI